VVRAVEGPANAALLVPTADGLAVRRFVENGEIAPGSEALGKRAMADRLWRNTLVSPDGQVGVVIVQPIDNYPETDLKIVDSIASALSQYRDQGFTFFVVGDAITAVVGGRDLAESMGRTVPFLVLVIGLILYAATRSWQHTLTALATMAVALLWTFGLLGWLAWPQDGILEVLAPLILVVGVCDAVHVLARYANARREASAAPRTALIARAARDAGPACLITTLTTAGAYLSFTTSALDTFERFGFISAFGVVACLALTFSLLPLLTAWLPADAPRVEKTSRAWRDVMDAVIRTTSKRSTTLLAASAILFVFFGFGWMQLRVDQDWLESWGENSSIVESIRFLEERLGVSSSLELDITLPSGTEFEDPGTLADIQTISDSLIAIPEFTHSTSVLTLMERLNRLLHDDDPAFERVGDSTAANAEILEILGFDDPETLGRWLSLDRSRLRISFDAQWLPHSTVVETLDRVHRSVAKSAHLDWRVIPSGEIAINHDWIRDLQATQLRSFPVAFAIVFVLVSVFLRSWKLGLAAMVPTLLPVVVVLGLMGWAGLTLDVARAMLAALVIGIGVDDAVHILAQYKARRDEGLDARAAMQGALRHTGRAVVTTSAALALGFLTLMMSAWQTIASFGFLVSIAIIGALAASLFVLPALVFAFAPNRETAAEPAVRPSPGEAT